MNAQKTNEKYSKKVIEIDMTPMTDLAFLLLTFFMLTTTFSNPQAMELVMPLKPDPEEAAQVQAVKESKALSIVLSGEDRIFWYMGLTDPEVEETDFSEQGIREVLRQKQATVDKLVVLIKPDEDSRFENLVDILDEMNLNQIERYTLVEIQEEDQKIIAPYKEESA